MSDKNYTQPIVDTDIWFFLIQSGFEKRLIERYGFIFVSDIVEKEILKWKNNKGRSKEIALKFLDYKEMSKVKVLYQHSFTKLEQDIINHQLADYGLQNISTMEKNKGEFVSFFYALHLSLQIFKTNDRHFRNEVEKIIQNKIRITNWEELLDKYSMSIKEKAEAIKVTHYKQKKMQSEKLKNQDPRWDALKALVG